MTVILVVLCEQFHLKIDFLCIIKYTRYTDITTGTTKAALNKKTTDVESKKPDITSIATNVAFNTKPTGT